MGFKGVQIIKACFRDADNDIIYFNKRYLNGELQVLFDELNCDVTNFEILKAFKERTLGRLGGPDCVLNIFLSMASII